jgi:hypothetical protein
MFRLMRFKYLVAAFLLICPTFLPASTVYSQTTQRQKVELGSSTAKNGFKNESEIASKFNNWRTDTDARNWLASMNYHPAEIVSVRASKPHGEKADVEVRIRTPKDEKVEGISIKLVSNPNGFNQIDKRWLSHYARMWKMPAEVHEALKLFVGENTPAKPGRLLHRTFLDELSAEQQNAVIAFFEANKSEIVSDLFKGDGPHSAGWVMVAFKATTSTRWALKRVEDVIRYYSEGPVKITSGGNLRIGRITMQRKGGDGGRDTAKMLQFKINPALLIGN